MYRYRCPRCGRPGFVRAETIIKAGYAVVELSCGKCDFQWREASSAPRVPRRDEE